MNARTRFVAPPAARSGQYRRSRFGWWQWRVSVLGEVYSPWFRTLSYNTAMRRLADFGCRRIEMADEW